MRSCHNDDGLRLALYHMYLAQFDAFKKYPSAFDNNHMTRMLTSLMGSRLWSWRVIGITEEALTVFAQHDFKRPAGQIQRGHREGRSETAKLLFNDQLEKAMTLDAFFDFFLSRDQTVLMLRAQNKRSGVFPEHIPIDQDLNLFPCGSLIGWQHRSNEVTFLRELYKSRTKSAARGERGDVDSN